MNHIIMSKFVYRKKKNVIEIILADLITCTVWLFCHLKLSGVISFVIACNTIFVTVTSQQTLQ